MTDRLTRALARTHVFFSRLSHSSLFRREETRLENARFSHLHELEQLAAEAPATGTGLLLGVGAYRRVLRVRGCPVRC